MNITKRILIVDDEPLIIDSIMVLVDLATREIPGFILKDRVDFAYEGARALEQVKYMQSLGNSYSLILMDCNMPVMDGY